MVRFDFIENSLVTNVKKMEVNVFNYIQGSWVIEVNKNLEVNVADQETQLTLHALEKLSPMD